MLNTSRKPGLPDDVGTRTRGPPRIFGELVSLMLRMLVTYEIELTAFYLVLAEAQEKIIRAEIPWDMQSNVRKIISSPALQVEAEAEYAPFAALLQKLSPENLEIDLLR